MKTDSGSKPWYGEGLRFTCRRCRSCCGGEPGYVFLRRGEAEAIAAHLGIGEEEFRGTWTRQAGDRSSLREEKDGRCVFLGEEGCRIYSVRPVQCRTFPFWLWNLVKRENWNETALECPGMGRGRLYSRKEIEEFLARLIG